MAEKGFYFFGKIDPFQISFWLKNYYISKINRTVATRSSEVELEDHNEWNFFKLTHEQCTM